MSLPTVFMQNISPKDPNAGSDIRTDRRTKRRLYTLESIIKVLSSPIRNYLKTTLIKHTMWRTQLTRGSTSLIQSLRCCTLDLSILTCITTLSNTFNVTLPHCWTFACNTKTICVL